MNIISVKERPEYKEKAIQYFQSKWANKNSLMVYEDCIANCITTSRSLPQWYLLEDDGVVIGCAGLITNDFISRMDLYSWVCALYIEKDYRGKGIGCNILKRLIQHTESQKVSFINIDNKCLSIFEFLQNLRVENFIDQYEMMLNIQNKEIS